MEDETGQGLIFRVPKAMLPAITDLSERTGIPRSVIARILLEHALADPPKWMKDLMGRRGVTTPLTAGAA